MTSTPTPQRHPGFRAFPPKAGLYDPAFEKDSCGIGFIAHLKGKASHAIVRDALEMLHRMDHRGACGCETNTGDGAGILTALPHDLLRKVAKRDADIDLPAPGSYAAGILFMPVDDEPYRLCKDRYEEELARLGLPLLGWRDVPLDLDAADLGPSALRTMPRIQMLFVARPDDLDPGRLRAPALPRPQPRHQRHGHRRQS